MAGKGKDFSKMNRSDVRDLPSDLDKKRGKVNGA